MGQYAKIFKAYDIRGIVPDELDEGVAEAVGAAFVRLTGAPAVVTAHDMRTSSPALAEAFGRGACAQGADVIAAGLGSTDLLYYASGSLNIPGAMITASHNPSKYNGIKLCLAGAKPVGEDSGLTELAEMGAAAGETLPTYHGQIANIAIANPGYRQASASPTEFVTFNTRMLVSPGRHICKVVFRDDNTGKLGAEEVRFDAPDYGAAPAASTLLVTHHGTPVAAGAAAGSAAGVDRAAGGPAGARAGEPSGVRVRVGRGHRGASRPRDVRRPRAGG